MPHELNPNIQFRNLIGDLSDTVDEAILHAMESSASDQLLASLAEARGGVVRMEHAVKIVVISIPHDEPRVYADELPKPRPNELPPLKPVSVKRVGVKLKSPLDFECPTCHAEAGATCFKFDRRGQNASLTDERHPPGGPAHKARTALSRNYNSEQKRAYDRKHGIANAGR